MKGSIIQLNGYNKEMCINIYKFIHNTMQEEFVPKYKTEQELLNEIQGIKEREAFNKYSVFYIYFLNGKIAGTVGLMEVDNKTFRLKRFYVKKEHRHMGIRSSLLDEATRYSDIHNKDIILSAGAHLDTAIQLYKKFGFNIVGVTKDSVKMERGMKK